MKIDKQYIKTKATQMLDLFGSSGNGWAKHHLAYTVKKGGRGGKAHMSGPTIEPSEDTAQSWCLMGASLKLGGAFEPKWLTKAIKKYSNHVCTADFNDEDGWAPIKDFLTQLSTYGEIKKPQVK